MKKSIPDSGGGGVEPPGLHKAEEDLQRFRELYSRTKGKKRVIDRILLQGGTPCSGVCPGAAREAWK